jgi:hypothetical protein
MYSELQEHDLLRSETQDRVLAERHHWKNKLEFTNNKHNALLSKCNDEVTTVGKRGTNQLCLLERYLAVLVKHTTEIPPLTTLVEVRP